MCMSTECTDGLIHKYFLFRAVLCFPLLQFSPVYGANMSILCLFLLHNQIDKGSKIKIMPLSAVFIVFYFGTGYGSWSHEKNITNILMNVVNLLPRLRIIFLCVFIRTPLHTPFYHCCFLWKIHISQICLQICLRCSKESSIFLSCSNVTCQLCLILHSKLWKMMLAEKVWVRIVSKLLYILITEIAI